MSTTTVSAPSVQVKVTLPAQLQEFAQSKADRFGMTLSSYIKHLVLDDVKNAEYPIMKASKKTEDSYKKAMQERSKAIEVNDVNDYFDSL
jgi:antitoxin component of RelBE/YafQ-DinJ toxin-antitoxin module